MTNEDDIIELTCIINNEPQCENLNMAWLKFNSPSIYKINCDRYVSIIIIILPSRYKPTNGHSNP